MAMAPIIPLTVQHKLDDAVEQGLTPLLNLDQRSITTIAALPVITSELVIEDLIQTMRMRQHSGEPLDANMMLQDVLAREERIKNSPLGADKERRIHQLLNRTGYTLFVGPEMRRYGGPPPQWGQRPKPQGPEVFIGHVPQDCFEDELVPLLDSIGPLHELRVYMSSNPAVTRQFALAAYCYPEDAQKAFQQLAGVAIRPQARLYIRPASINTRLFVGGVPRVATRDDLLHEFKMQEAGIVDVIVKPSKDKLSNRGFCFVDMIDENVAKTVFNAISSGQIRIQGRLLQVNWARPEESSDQADNSNNKTIYVANLDARTPDRALFDVFDAYGPVRKIRHINTFAFVEFETHAAAQAAKTNEDAKLIDGSQVTITWARPHRSSKPLQGGNRAGHSPVGRRTSPPGGQRNLGRHSDRPAKGAMLNTRNTKHGYRPNYDDDVGGQRDRPRGGRRRSRSPVDRSQARRGGGRERPRQQSFGYRPTYDDRNRGAVISGGVAAYQAASSAQSAPSYNTYEPPSFDVPSSEPRDMVARDDYQPRYGEDPGYDPYQPGAYYPLDQPASNVYEGYARDDLAPPTQSYGNEYGGADRSFRGGYYG
eukprot:TRINITY_DN8347_c0_g3_i2.p1 TRINITY_DN8347_c0_g3~~TRINITY_DN8347_c0_g3_i2.p1  ORF type:complete len:594 (+),score=84.73 TRINITY_DN8347_c0_g3_i2:110-1891(+)